MGKAPCRNISRNKSNRNFVSTLQKSGEITFQVISRKKWNKNFVANHCETRSKRKEVFFRKKVIFFHSSEEEIPYYCLFMSTVSLKYTISRNFVLVHFVWRKGQFRKARISRNKQFFSRKNGIRFASIAEFSENRILLVNLVHCHLENDPSSHDTSIFTPQAPHSHLFSVLFFSNHL
jgi:ATP-dependent Zn protease